VDDGSSDMTPRIADAAAERFTWVHVTHRRDRGNAAPERGSWKPFMNGYAATGRTYLGFPRQLDGDLSFGPDYFAGCLQRFLEEARLGIAGGTVCRQDRAA